MNGKVFVSCAVTGSGDTASKHPDLPKTPEQIAKAIIEVTQQSANMISNAIYRKEIGLYIKELRPYKVNFSIQKNINFSNINKIANNLARPFKNFKVLKF